jgi:HK97 family phage major capsid protein
VTATTVTAPELTREQVIAILVQPLEQTSVFLAAGPRIFDVEGGPVRIPSLVASDSPSWHGEAELIEEVEVDFGEIQLLPSNLASIKSLTRFSSELARQSVIALDAALRDRMVRDVAAKLDAAFIAGDGTPTGTGKLTPVGILNWTGVQTVAAVGTPTLDDLQDAVGLAMAANVETSRLTWFMTSRDFVGLRKLKDGSQRYQLQPDPTQEGLFRLLGHRVIITNRIPATGGDDDDESTIVLADMSTVAVARDLAPSVKLLDQTFAATDELGIRVTCRMDCAPMLPEAVIRLEGVTP